MAKRAVKALPGNAQVLDTLALVQRQRKDKTGAFASVQARWRRASVQLDPTFEVKLDAVPGYVACDADAGVVIRKASSRNCKALALRVASSSVAMSVLSVLLPSSTANSSDTTLLSLMI